MRGTACSAPDRRSAPAAALAALRAKGGCPMGAVGMVGARCLAASMADAG